MKTFKIIIALLGICIGAIPVILFVPLTFVGGLKWLMMLKNLPTLGHYLLVLSIIFSGIFLAVSAIGFYLITIKEYKKTYNDECETTID